MTLKHSQIIEANNTIGMGTIEAARFHLHNENGLYRRYKAVYDKLTALLDDQKISHAQFNNVYSPKETGSFDFSRIMQLSEQKRPSIVK